MGRKVSSLNTIADLVAQWKRVHHKAAQSHERMVYRIIQMYLRFCGRDDTLPFMLNTKACRTLTETTLWKQAESFYNQFCREVDASNLELESYMRFAFNHAAIFYGRFSKPRMTNLASVKMMVLYKVWKSRQPNDAMLVATETSSIAKKRLRIYRKALEPIWGDRWRLILSTLLAEPIEETE